MGTNITSLSGFIRAFFRAREFGAALLCAGLLSCPVAVSAKIPRGVFSIANVDKDPNTNALENPDVDGISLRHMWATLEPTEGDFDFTYLDGAVALCTANGKQALIRIGTQEAKPAWVTTAVKRAHGQFFTFLNGGVTTSIPVFWDPTYLAKKTAMITALGAHFTNNPTVTIVVASFANSTSEDWGVPHTAIDVTNWLRLGYTTQLMLDTGATIINTTMEAFPNQFVTMAVGGSGHVNGLNLDPTADYVARNAVLNARAAYPGRMIAQKNDLKTCIPVAPGTDTLYSMIWDFQPDVGAQMAFQCFNDSTYKANCGIPIDPALALTLSVTAALTYGEKYVEIYSTDVVNLPAVITWAHAALNAQ